MSGPCTTQLSACTATKFSMIVLITSLTSRRARSHPASPPQSAPPSAPAPRMITIASGCGQSPSDGPIAPAAIAPIVSCPSPPIFQSAPENAIDTASPVKTSGVAFTIVSAHAYQLPNSPSPSAMNTPNGDAPRPSSTIEIIASASANAPSGFAIEASIAMPRPDLFPGPAHQQAELPRTSLVSARLTNFSMIDNHQAPPRREQLVEIARDQQDRAAPRSEF